MRKNNNPQRVDVLKSELNKVRNECLLATRQNDYRRMAQLTLQAAQLNRVLREAAVLD